MPAFFEIPGRDTLSAVMCLGSDVRSGRILCGRVPALVYSPNGQVPRQRGFSLIEVAVAVLVLGVGLLGLAALQATGLKMGQSSQLRTLATMAAIDLSERLRSDPNNAEVGAEPSWSIAPGDCPFVGHSNAEERWKSDFCAIGLPAPREAEADAESEANWAEVVCGSEGCGGEGNCEIVVRWDDSRGDPKGSTDSNKTFRLCTRLPRAV